MLSSLANYLLGGNIPDARNSQGSNNGTSESHAVMARLNQVEVEDKDWILVDHADEGTTALEESWYVTPPACFTRAGPVNVETSPLEDLLIEHPSMSVYRATTSPVVSDTPPLTLDMPEVQNLEEDLLFNACVEPLFFDVPKSLPAAASSERSPGKSAKKKPATDERPIIDARRGSYPYRDGVRYGQVDDTLLIPESLPAAASSERSLRKSAKKKPATKERTILVARIGSYSYRDAVRCGKVDDTPLIPESLPAAASSERSHEKRAKKKSAPNKRSIIGATGIYHYRDITCDLERIITDHELITAKLLYKANPCDVCAKRIADKIGPFVPKSLPAADSSESCYRKSVEKPATKKLAIHDGRPAADRIRTEKVLTTIGSMQKVLEMRFRPSALDERSKQPSTRGCLKEKFRHSLTNNFLEQRYRQPLTRGYLERGNKLREVFGVRGKRPRRQDRLRIKNSGANNNRKC